jgi:DNA ligase 1
VLLARIAETSTGVAGTAARLRKVDLLATALAELRPEEVPVGVAYLSGTLPHPPIGVGWATLRELPAPSADATLELLEVDRALRRVGETTGAGSQQRRRAELEALFARATEQERRFLAALLVGELRQGAQEGVMADAVARAAGVPAADVRRAAMLAGDLRAAAVAALRDGGAGLERFRLTVLRPVQPMLAQTADDVEAALERIRPAVVEWKLDGARLQVHRLGGEVRAFTRNLADVTDRVPEVVEAVAELTADAIVLDGEVIALAHDGKPEPFQVTMSRFGTRRSDERGVVLSSFFFDCLHLDSVDLLDHPLTERLAALDACLPASLRVPRILTDDPAEAEAFLADVLERGHEGVMVKAPSSPYEAGRRGSGWVKVKRAHTLDLVVLAAEWGHGRRSGRLSNLHLGARDEGAGGFVMLGKTFKGMTDELLAWQTERLLGLETSRSGHTVHVRPELVVEIAFDGIQRSTRYPGGVALRFARVKGYRPDKRPEEADTIETVRAVGGV